MARGDFYVFNEFLVALGSGKYNLPSDTLKLGIITNAATPLITQTTPTWADFSANEVSGTGYSAGGITLTGVTWAQVAGVTKLDSDAMQVAYDAAGFDDGYFGILYDTTATNDDAIGFLDLGGPVGNDVENLDINPPAAGWVTYARKA